jgi:ribose transport system substrate-binding protein
MAKTPPAQRFSDAKKTSLVTQIGSARNPYDAWWSKGGRLCAAAFDMPYIVLESEGEFSRKGLGQIADAIVKTKGNMVLNLNAPSSPNDLKRLIDLCINHKIYFVTQNNMPSADFRPWGLSPYYVAHIDFDHKLAGFKTARQMITAMGGKGGIVALGGKVDNPFALRQLSGLDAALATAPNCHKLAAPADAEWEASAAYDIMRSLIAEHGVNQIAGVWAANDDMALGAIEALRLYKRFIPVTGIGGIKEGINAIQAGTMTATVAWDSFLQGGIGLSLALSAKMGLVDPSAEPHSHRAFYAPFSVVTGDNVLSFIEYRDAEHPLTYCRDFWGPSTGAISDE